MAKENITASIHFDLSEMGVRKRLHQTFDLQEAEEVKRRMIKILKNRGISMALSYAVESDYSCNGVKHF